MQLDSSEMSLRGRISNRPQWKPVVNYRLRRFARHAHFIPVAALVVLLLLIIAIVAAIIVVVIVIFFFAT